MFFWRASRRLRAAVWVGVGTEVHSVFDYFSGLRGCLKIEATLTSKLRQLPTSKLRHRIRHVKNIKESSLKN